MTLKTALTTISFTVNIIAFSFLTVYVPILSAEKQHLMAIECIDDLMQAPYSEKDGYAYYWDGVSSGLTVTEFLTKRRNSATEYCLNKFF